MQYLNLKQRKWDVAHFTGVKTLRPCAIQVEDPSTAQRLLDTPKVFARQACFATMLARADVHKIGFVEASLTLEGACGATLGQKFVGRTKDLSTPMLIKRFLTGVVGEGGWGTLSNGSETLHTSRA